MANESGNGAKHLTVEDSLWPPFIDLLHTWRERYLLSVCALRVTALFILGSLETCSFYSLRATLGHCITLLGDRYERHLNWLD